MMKLMKTIGLVLALSGLATLGLANSRVDYKTRGEAALHCPHPAGLTYHKTDDTSGSITGKNNAQTKFSSVKADDRPFNIGPIAGKQKMAGVLFGLKDSVYGYTEDNHTVCYYQYATYKHVRILVALQTS